MTRIGERTLGGHVERWKRSLDDWLDEGLVETQRTSERDKEDDRARNTCERQ